MIGLSLEEIRVKIAKDEISVESMTKVYLEAIEHSRSLNIYVKVYGEEALSQARILDEKYKQDPASVGRLFGAIVSIKDVICYKGHPVTAGSKILTGFESLFDATVVERLLAEDAIIIGSTNCDEFAMGSSNENSFYGPTRNADNPEYIPGGSSGGAAVAVQANTCLIAIGSDTGGSVRQPAAFCGVIGMKPSYGRISRYGLIAYASSFDQIGLVARHTSDLALALEIISGKDEYDSTVSQKEVPGYQKNINTQKKLKIGVLDSFFDHPKMNQEIRSNSKLKLEQLKDAGHDIVPIEFSMIDYLVPAYYVLTTAEASSNLSRFDGVKYGYRSQNISDLESLYRSTRSEGFGMEVKRRIMLGAFVLSSGYYDAYFEKAQKIRNLIKKEIEQLFEEVDVIALPISMDYPWKIGDQELDPVTIYLSDVFTVIANLCGIPGISIPLARGENKMSSGIQLLSNSFQEQHLFDLSAYLQTVA